MNGKRLNQKLSRRVVGALLCATGLGLLAPLQASAEDADNGVAAIEMRRLLQPTPAELAQEQKGRIYIYDGLRAVDIENAMETAFDRIENMMFIRVRKTDEHGKTLRDSTTGEVQFEDDGC
ncbi:MAG: hypothetical protein GVY09_02835 [Gammaproteobacteria bacterium]|jgi:hypothetical protein|nr:hypothetical protein [Gammaproteobacteria bacterium]